MGTPFPSFFHLSLIIPFVLSDPFRFPLFLSRLVIRQCNTECSVQGKAVALSYIIPQYFSIAFLMHPTILFPFMVAIAH